MACYDWYCRQKIKEAIAVEIEDKAASKALQPNYYFHLMPVPPASKTKVLEGGGEVFFIFKTTLPTLQTTCYITRIRTIQSTIHSTSFKYRSKLFIYNWSLWVLGHFLWLRWSFWVLDDHID